MFRRFSFRRDDALLFWGGESYYIRTGVGNFICDEITTARFLRRLEMENMDRRSYLDIGSEEFRSLCRNDQNHGHFWFDANKFLIPRHTLPSHHPRHQQGPRVKPLLDLPVH